MTRDLRDDGRLRILNQLRLPVPCIDQGSVPESYALTNVGTITTSFLADADDYLDEVLGERFLSTQSHSGLCRRLDKNYFGNRLITL